jgi:hypothetical protein
MAKASCHHFNELHCAHRAIRIYTTSYLSAYNER